MKPRDMLTDQERRVLQKIIDRESLAVVAERVGIATATLRSVVGGLPGRKTTIFAIRAGLVTKRAS